MTLKMSGKPIAHKTTESRNVRVVWLGEDIGLAQELVPFFRDRGMNVEVVLAEGTSVTVAADLALAYFSDPAGAGGVMHAGSALRTLVWPPLVAIVTRNPSKADVERMRRQGVVHVCKEIDSTFGNVVRRLVDPTSCGKWRLQPGLLADALASAEKASASGMLCVSCSHWDGASTYPWENSSLFYCGDHGGGKCSGWAGRIYLVGGAITLAETPLARGTHALQQMLQLSEGSVMRFPFYLSPDATDPLGPVSTALLRNNEATETAALLKDLRRSERGVEVVAERGVDRGALSRSSAPKEAPMSDLEAVLAISPAFSGAIRIAADGNPIASAGSIDAPLVAAVAHLAFDHALGVAAALPLGSVLGFSVGGRSSAFFVRRSAKSRTTLVVRSGATQTPNRTLSDLSRFT